MIRKAQSRESGILSELAIRSKAYWGYSPEFMQSCAQELTVSTTDIENSRFHYYVSELVGEILGFYAIEDIGDRKFELDALFVKPECIGTGIGKALIAHAIANASALGGVRLFIQSDPNAAEFYERAGGILIGTKESLSISGRLLPTYEIALE